MNVLLTAHGSRGDVSPMLALGRRFRADGHRVVMLTQANYRLPLEAAGIEGLYTSEDIRREMASLGSGWRGVPRILDWSRRSLADEFLLLEDVVGDMDLVVCTNQEFSVASLAQWRRLPAFRLSYIPAIPGDHTPPLIPWQDLPVVANRLVWKGLGAGLDFMAKGTVNAWRKAHGLPTVRSLTPHMTSTFLTLYAFNRTLAPPHPSWNPDTFRYCGYCFEDDDESLPADLEAFLADGDPPVYFGFGSITVPDPDGVTRMVLEAAGRAGCRLVLSRGWTGLGADSVLAEGAGRAWAHNVFVTDDVPHAALFPRLAGVCHHGGAGTTHRAGLTGTPQLVMPVIVDQHFWGSRIHHLGAGPRPVELKKLTVKALERAFRSFVHGTPWAMGTKKLARSMAQDGGIAAAYNLILKSVNGQRESAAEEATASSPAPGHATASSPAPGHASASSPAPGHASASSPAPGHASASSPAPGHATASSPAPGHATASSPAPGHATAQE